MGVGQLAEAYVARKLLKDLLGTLALTCPPPGTEDVMRDTLGHVIKVLAAIAVKQVVLQLHVTAGTDAGAALGYLFAPVSGGTSVAVHAALGAVTATVMCRRLAGNIVPHLLGIAERVYRIQFAQHLSQQTDAEVDLQRHLDELLVESSVGVTGNVDKSTVEKTRQFFLTSL